jgi:multidrug resistance efflux pump
MSNTLQPQKVLSQLEDHKCDELTLRLAALNSRRDMLNREVEVVDMQLADIKKQRELLSQDTTTALQFSTLEAVRREELGRKKILLAELETIPAEEQSIRADIFVCMNKSKAYTKLMENEEKLQQKHISNVEQQSIDDLMAHRRTRKE